MTTLVRRRSAFHEIELFVDEAGHLGMTLDHFWQFSAQDEAIFHEALVHPAICRCARPRRVLILGGGDGLAAREVLRYDEVEMVDLVDLDPLVLELAREHEELRALNLESLHDPRLREYAMDARDFLSQTRAPYDVIIVDFPAPVDPIPTPLFRRGFFGRLADFLDDAGIVSIQVSLDPPAFWDVLRELDAAFDWTEPRLVALADDQWADSILAARGAHAPVRDLPEGLSFFRREHHESLAIRSRDGERLTTQAYGEGPDFDDGA